MDLFWLKIIENYKLMDLNTDRQSFAAARRGTQVRH